MNSNETINNMEPMEASLAILPAHPYRKFDFVSSPIITVVVVQDDRSFSIHQDVLLKSAPFWEAHSGEQWKAPFGPFRVSNVSAETFSQYVQWAYSGRVIVTDPVVSFEIKVCDLQKAGPEEDREWIKDQYDALVDLVIFANQAQSVALQNDVATTILDLVDKIPRLCCSHCPYPSTMLPRPDAIVRAYSSLPTECPIRALFAHLIASVLDMDELKTAEEDWIPAAMAAEINAMINPVRPSMSNERGACRFHQHGQGIPLCGEMQALRKEEVGRDQESKAEETTNDAAGEETTEGVANLGMREYGEW